ncbi:hypothetical protein Xmau_00052 [Xenorhabdus mauleonii]|uniref:Uncharacterized protein n=1 Tax=Xenorhabdus mauleonii TaxID=351675 RepID=A0A1I3NI79_9GAMM|nr:hypothetical protein Xmau_00052 [Xenorhabdus mauleonii]SFJ08887.1 hypothetical protein SAMN05421680_105207 [Xenorhabdus mauleonii]
MPFLISFVDGKLHAEIDWGLKRINNQFPNALLALLFSMSSIL